jgi:predicted transcriptional regulator
MKKKKESILGVRVEADIEEQIRSLAEKEDRSISWMLRHLIIEGLKAKGLTQRKIERTVPR